MVLLIFLACDAENTYPHHQQKAFLMENVFHMHVISVPFITKGFVREILKEHN